MAGRIPRRLAGIGASDLENSAEFDLYVGPSREVTVDHVRGIFALHDGITPGGKRVTVGEGSSQLVDAPRLIQKKMMEPFFGVGGTEIYLNASFTAQDHEVVTMLDGTKYWFVLQRCQAFNYKKEERCRIVQFAYMDDGSIGQPLRYSAELNVGHSSLKRIYTGDDTIKFITWLRTDDGAEDNNAGRGFSIVTWDGSANEATTQANVVAYKALPDEYYHADVSVNEDATLIVFHAYRKTPNTDGFVDQTIIIKSFPALLGAANDAARIAVPAIKRWVHKSPIVDRGMYKQGMDIRGNLIVTQCGFTNPLVPKVINFFTLDGEWLRSVQPSGVVSEYGELAMLDHPSGWTPMQNEPEGISILEDGSVAFMICDQWRSGASIVTYTSPFSGVTQNYSYIGSTAASPMEVDNWCPTKKAATAGAWNPATSYTIGAVEIRRKVLYKIDVPKGEAGELELIAGRDSTRLHNPPLVTYENGINFIRKAGSSFGIGSWSENLQEFSADIEMLFTPTTATVWRMDDYYYRGGPKSQMSYSWNARTGRRFASFGFASGAGAMTIYGDSAVEGDAVGDSDFDGQLFLRNRGGGGLRVLKGSTGALAPYNTGAPLGTTTYRFGAFTGTSIDINGAAAIGTNLTVGGTFATTGTATFTAAATFNGGATVAGNLSQTPVAFASIGTAAAAGAGAKRVINNCNSTTYRAVAAGGGANLVTVMSDGTNWLIGA